MSTSFQDYIQQTFDSVQYPLNQIAQSYLQDWYAGRAVAALDGGIAFEAPLRKLDLDGSFASLASLDKFLTVIKPHFVSSYLLLHHQTNQKNLLVFLAFYTGMVWGYQAKINLYWTSFGYLTQQYPALIKAIDDDFSYSLAVSAELMSEVVDNRPVIMLGLGETLFFPLVAIIERLYPRRQDFASGAQVAFFGYSSDSLEKSVQQLLAIQPNSPKLETLTDFSLLENHANPRFIQPLPKGNLSKHSSFGEDILFTDKRTLLDFDNGFFETVRSDYQPPFLVQSPTPKANTSVSELKNTKDEIVTDTKTAIIDSRLNLAPFSAVKASVNTETTETTIKKPIAFTAKQTAQSKYQEKQRQERERQQLEQARQQKIAEALANPQLHEGLLNQRKSIIEQQKVVKIVDSFSELEAALQLSQDSNQLANQPIQQAKSEQVLQAEQKAQAILASEARKARRSAENKFGTKLIKKLPEINQLTEIGQPKELDIFDLLVPETTNSPVNSISIANAELDGQYHQACQWLQDLQQQTDPDKDTVKQMLSSLQQLAKQQHTGAMLQLALLRFRSAPAFGVAKDETQALKLIQTAAKLGDNRAEKLLSKCYFSGQGVSLSPELGNYWLEQAASHGNADARKLLADMAIAQKLRHTKQNDTIYGERLLMGVVLLVVFMLAIIFLVKV